jgi:hypothetical protein
MEKNIIRVHPNNNNNNNHYNNLSRVIHLIKRVYPGSATDRIQGYFAVAKRLLGRPGCRLQINAKSTLKKQSKMVEQFLLVQFRGSGEFF